MNLLTFRFIVRLAPIYYIIMDQNNHQEEDLKIIPSHTRRHRATIESDEEDQLELIQKMKASHVNSSRKKLPTSNQNTPEKEEVVVRQPMDIEYNNTSKADTKILKYNQLPQEIDFYLTQIYPFTQNKLFITGKMQNGQTLNLVATQPLRQLYFCLRREYSDTAQLSEGFKGRAQKQIKQFLHNIGINKIDGTFLQREYVFELRGVERIRRPYYRVRFPFSKQNYKEQNKDEVRPDWQGQTFKYVFGTTYSPLQLTILNGEIKGPGWMKVRKMFLNQNTRWVDSGICAQMQDPELLQVNNEIPHPPNMRVMSISLKAVMPSQVKLKRLFNTNNLEQLHIYAISYFYCENYLVDSKPSKYNGVGRTFFLKEFGAASKERDFVVCDNQKHMFAQFQAELRRLDPDVLVCHDSAKIIDTLIQRMARLGKQEKPRLGRLIYAHQLNMSNQTQRISSTVAGRLVCDTFQHSRDMIRSVDYELESMATHIKPERVFRGMDETTTLDILNENKAFQVVRKCREQAEITFALMNHLQILQMTRQLSNICGNTWKRSLQLQRAERNEYLIMHQCKKRQLIIPDKFRKEKGEEDEQVDRKKYQGGHVIDPEKGFYKDYILLLDFNSLYPSIIRQYNVCFSVIQRPFVPLTNYYKKKEKEKKKKEKKEQGEQMNDQIQEMQVRPPGKQECTREKWGFLPQLIDKIVKRRKDCKKRIKTAPADKAVILDIQQKCYKLVANSIYGCLGFSISRFYSKHLAALITRMGRQALMRAKEIVSSNGAVRVIYGDTDSLMIQPLTLHEVEKEGEKAKLLQIKKVADQLKGQINKEYSNLQIDIDGIFKPLILLMKKKYVARMLKNFDEIIAGKENQLKFNLQFKGIEVVRRDGFQLARKFLRTLLEMLMNSTKSQPQETYQEIYQYAKQFVTNEFRADNYRGFLFSRQLNKAPSQYNRGQTIPHVKVALDRVKNGQRVETLVNHTIYYIVCKPLDKNQDSLAKCCFDDRTFQRSQRFDEQDKKLQIDQEYYKRQLLQPVGRITQHLAEFSTDRLLQEIGLSDQGRKKFKRQLQAEREEGEALLQGSISHSTKEKSKHFSQRMGQLACPCGFKVTVAEEGKITLSCPSCHRGIIPAISNRIHLLMRKSIADYYDNNFKCKCNKQYSLTPISECCKIKYKPRSVIPFELHQFVYMGKQLILATNKELGGDTQKRLKGIQKKFDDFLAQSDYENVPKAIDIMKI